MTAYTQVQHAIAQFAEQITPELKRQIVRFTFASLGIGLLALLVLLLIGASYEPFTWCVLVLRVQPTVGLPVVSLWSRRSCLRP